MWDARYAPFHLVILLYKKRNRNFILPVAPPFNTSGIRQTKMTTRLPPFPENHRPFKRLRLVPAPKPVNILSLPSDALRKIFSHLEPRSESLNRQAFTRFPPAHALASTCNTLYSLCQAEYKLCFDVIDLAYPGCLEDPPLLQSSISCEHSFHLLPSICGPRLRVLRLPHGFPTEQTKEIISAAIANCPALSEISFVDDGVLDTSTLKELSECERLQKIEVRNPSKLLLVALKTAFASIEEIVLRRVSPDHVESVKTVIRIRRWRSLNSKCHPLKLFWIGLNLKSALKWEQNIQYWEHHGIIEDFLTYLTEFSRRDMCDLRSFRIFDYYGDPILEQFFKRVKHKFHHGSSIFSKETEVGFESKDGATTIVPRLTDSSHIRETSMSLQYLMSCVRNQKAEKCIDELSHADTMHISAHMFTKRYVEGTQSIRDGCKEILRRGGGKVRRVQVWFPLDNYAHTLQRPLNVFTCLADLFESLPSVTTLEISSEIIEWASNKMKQFTDLFSKCGNLRVLHLKNPSQLARSRCTSSWDLKARLIRRVPVFLQILSLSCPKLQHLYLGGSKKNFLYSCEGKKLTQKIKLALNSIHRYEEDVRSVEAGTLRAQLETWLHSMK